MTRLRRTTVLAEPGVVLLGAEIEFDQRSGTVSYLGPDRGGSTADDFDAADRIVIPGFTNGHTHSAMTLLRGYSDDVPLHTWLGHMRAFELRMTADDIRAGVRLAVVEMLRTGTVGFIDMFGWDADCLGDVAAAGMRVNAAPTVFGYRAVAFPKADARPGAAVLDDVPRLAREFEAEPLVAVSYGLHAPYTCPAALISDVARRAHRDQLAVQIHLSETRREVDTSKSDTGRSPIALMRDLGLLDGELHVAHAVHPVDDDIELLATPGVTVSHNPVSNLKLGAGIAPTPRYRDAGVRLAVGTDSVASNNSLDMFEEVKIGALLQRGVAEDPAALSGAQVFGWATRGGALAARAGGSGRIRVGEQADLVLLDTGGDVGTPLNDVQSFVYYAARGSEVTDVFIAGRRVVANRRVLTLDEAAVRHDVRQRVRRIIAELA